MAVESNNKLGNFSLLGEDELGLIVNKIKDPIDRKSFSEVCKEWLRVEGLHRSSLRVLRSGCLQQVLPRFPNLVKFKTSMSITDIDLQFLGQTCPRLEVLNLYGSNYYGHYSDSVGLIDLASNLTHLDLSFCLGVSDEAVEAIACFRSIIELSLVGNSVITDRALGYLANGNCSKTLKTLILAWVKNITDAGVSHLKTMHCLEYLSLASYSKGHLTDISGVAISAITTLKKLCLEKQPKLSDRTIVALAQNCPNIEILDLSGCHGVTGAGIRAFSGHQCLETIVLKIYKVSATDLDHLVLRCPSLKSIVMCEDVPLGQMQERTKKLVKEHVDEELLYW